MKDQESSPPQHAHGRGVNIDKAPVTESLLKRAWNEFILFLRHHGARVTQARKVVLEAALTRRDHFRADDLASSLSHGPDRVSRGTVYRTLALMVEAGLIREVRDTDVHVHYEPAFGQPEHEHLICDQCGAFIEFIDRDISDRIEKVCKENDFQSRTHRVVVFGVCRNCQGDYRSES